MREGGVAMTDGLLRTADRWRARPAGRRRHRWRLTRRGRVVFGGLAVLHWGEENQAAPSPSRHDLARRLLAALADRSPPPAARQPLEASRDRTSRAVGPAAPPLPPD
jgi:hypothetical protein